jgi:hypothetical protein
VVLAQLLDDPLAVGVGGAQGRPPLVSRFPVHGRLLATGGLPDRRLPGMPVPN